MILVFGSFSVAAAHIALVLLVIGISRICLWILTRRN